jgi:hypothetical protein
VQQNEAECPTFLVRIAFVCFDIGCGAISAVETANFEATVGHWEGFVFRTVRDLSGVASDFEPLDIDVD